MFPASARSLRTPSLWRLGQTCRGSAMPLLSHPGLGSALRNKSAEERSSPRARERGRTVRRLHCASAHTSCTGLQITSASFTGSCSRDWEPKHHPQQYLIYTPPSSFSYLSP